MRIAFRVVAAVVMAGVQVVSQQVSFTHERGRVYFDDIDGVLWVRGDDFKASFSGEAASFVPFLGSSASRNYPVTMRVESVRAGSRTIGLAAAMGARRTGNSITIDRGDLVEAYAISAQEIEQTFRFEKPQGPGDLVVRLAVETDLAARRLDDGVLEFANERGGVRYGRPEVVDAAGRKAPMESAWRDGAIELTVPEAFLSDAEFPVTIDPVLASFGFQPNGGLQQLKADAAYDLSSDLYCVVSEEIFSATDHDVFVRTINALGATVTTGYVDYTTSAWAAPKIANNRIAAQFLCVAEKTLSGGATVIFGRTVQPTNPISMGVQFQISGFELGLKTHPDVGGDPSPSSPTYYCVCWQSTIGSNKNVYYNLVQADNSLVFSNNPTPFLGAPTANANSKPAISKSDGFASAVNQNWEIVFQRTYSATDEDIWGALVHWNGNVVDSGFGIDASGDSETDPAVSSITGDPTLGGPHQWLAVYSKLIPGNPPFVLAQYDLYGALFQGASAVTYGNLSSMFGLISSRDQIHPCVDSDGTRFAVGFTDTGGFVDQGVPYLATVHVAGGASLGVTELPVSFNSYSGLDDNLRITSKRSGGGLQYRYLAVADVQSTTTSERDIEGALYDGWSPAAGGAYVNYVLPGCGGLSLGVVGFPALGLGMTATLSGVQGTGFLALGAPISPVALCTGCLLGIDAGTATIIQATSLSATIPQDGSLVNAMIAVQGADIGSTTGCAGSPSFSLSDCVIVTIL